MGIGGRYHNDAVGRDCLNMHFCARGRGRAPFSEHVPHHMRELADGVYQNHNKHQVLVLGDPSSPRTVLNMGSLRGAEIMPDGCSCVMDFMYCHPGKNEALLRLVYDTEGRPRIVWDGREPLGEWSFHDFPTWLPNCQASTRANR